MTTWLLIGLTTIVILYEVWYAAAYMVAYVQLRERMLLTQVGQAVLMLVAFAYLVYGVLAELPVNPVIIGALLVGAMLLSILWRRNPAGLAQFLRSYPRGTVDVLFFRRPAIDLKRRVRTK